MRDWPGRRRSSSAWISSTVMGSRGGTPSMTQPTPLPCDSPKVVTRKAVPQVLAAPARVSVGAERRRWRRAEAAGRAEKARWDGDDEDAVADVDIADVDGLIFLFFCYE